MSTRGNIYIYTDSAAFNSIIHLYHSPAKIDRKITAKSSPKRPLARYKRLEIPKVYRPRPDFIPLNTATSGVISLLPLAGLTFKLPNPFSSKLIPVAQIIKSTRLPKQYFLPFCLDLVNIDKLGYKILKAFSNSSGFKHTDHQIIHTPSFQSIDSTLLQYNQSTLRENLFIFYTSDVYRTIKNAPKILQPYLPFQISN
jgi:hypothetical protein